MNRKKIKKAALAISALLFVLWWALGTGATLAWFSDTDSARNEFQIGLLDLEVSYRNDFMSQYEHIDSTTQVFNDKALYEPGYTQVVYLRIENRGNVDFNYKVAVTVEKVISGVNAWNEPIYLPNYLRYGVVFADTEPELEELVKDRLTARANTGDSLDTWSEEAFNVAGQYHYAALIVYMPEEVGNIANYRGADQPCVELGVKVFAQQANAPMN